MYGWIFRHLPGPLAVRIFIALALIVGAVYLLMVFVFPWMTQFSPFTENTTVGGDE